MELMLQPFTKYADFSGRARRSEYWLFALFQWLVVLAAGALTAILGGSGHLLGGLIAFAVGLFFLASIIPALAVLVRRLHDSDKSGFWAFIGLIPLIGGLALLVFSLMDGTEGDNRYGSDPKGRTARSV
ncbi:MAG TPA: DUF805 domain-containing protein [Caulobacteraceae bacterium]|jgi:uncharacterized membrane protein YhaH (DUF805 family)